MSQAKLRTPDPQIAAQLNQLAALYGDMGQLEQATALTEQSLIDVSRVVRGKSSGRGREPGQSRSIPHAERTTSPKRLPAFDEAIGIYRRLLPNNHPLHALALANEARAFDRLKRYREADPLYREALAMQRLVLGGKHPDLAATLNNLAVLLHALGRFLRQRAIQSRSDGYLGRPRANPSIHLRSSPRRIWRSH